MNKKPQSLPSSMQYVPMKPYLLDNKKPQTITDVFENTDGKEKNQGQRWCEEKEETKK